MALACTSFPSLPARTSRVPRYAPWRGDHQAGEEITVDCRRARGTSVEQVLAAVGGSLNVVLVRPERAAAAPCRGRDRGGRRGAAPGRRVAAPYVLVAAEPLAGVAAAWDAMWSLTGEAHGSDRVRAARGAGARRLAGQAVRAARLLPGLAERPPGGTRAGGRRRGRFRRARAARPTFPREPLRYLGPLRDPAQPGSGGRGSVVGCPGGRPAERARVAAARRAWWPPLDEIVRGTRLYPGSARESPATTLLS